MADTVTSQKLKDHATAWAYKFTNESDGTGESNVLKVDVSGLTAAANSALTNQRVNINKIAIKSHTLDKISLGGESVIHFIALKINEKKSAEINFIKSKYFKKFGFVNLKLLLAILNTNLYKFKFKKIN